MIVNILLLAFAFWVVPTELDKKNPDLLPCLISHGKKIGGIWVLLVTHSESIDRMCAAMKFHPCILDASWSNALTALRDKCRHESLRMLFGKDPNTSNFNFCYIADSAIIHGSLLQILWLSHIS